MKRQPATCYFAGFAYQGDPVKAQTATIERLVRHAVEKLEQQSMVPPVARDLMVTVSVRGNL